MWFPLALTAMLLLVTRRGIETKLVGHIPATSMAWLQQLVMLPFIALMMFLPWATFFNPFELSAQFWAIVAVYTVLGLVDGTLYFKAISLGNVSVLSGLLSLGVVSNLLGVYFLLGQEPSRVGLIASATILLGAYLASRKLVTLDAGDTSAHRTSMILMLIVVAVRGLYSPVEVTGMRETDPFFFNLITSLTLVPTMMAVAYWRGKRTGMPAFGKELRAKINTHWLGLLIVGLTFAINITFSFIAKMSTDNAAYVTTVKSAAVLPMMILGVLMFKEKVRKRQWLGLGIILAGLILFSQA